jgi:hypothetical protein
MKALLRGVSWVLAVLCVLAAGFELSRVWVVEEQIIYYGPDRLATVLGWLFAAGVLWALSKPRTWWRVRAEE